MITYDHATYAVRPEFGESHTRFWERLGQPGTWWTARERIAIAREVRAARQCRLCAERKASLSPYTVAGEHAATEELPGTAVEAVHRITTDAPRLTHAWYQGLIDEGLGAGQYVELLGTLVATISVDSFCLAIGVAENPLPAPVAGSPSRYTPERLEHETAWVPMVPADNAGTGEADLWPANRIGNVVRAMSLVPDEVRTLKDLSAAHYLPISDVRKAGKSRGGPLGRSQMELVAARVSLLNGCYY